MVADPHGNRGGSESSGRRATRFLSISELIAAQRPRYLVDGLVPQGGAVALIGLPATFKTIFAISLASSVALGVKFFGRSVRRGHVIYIAAEGRRGLTARFLAWGRHNSVEAEEFDGHISVVPHVIDFCDSEAIDALLADLDHAGITPVLVIVDTLARCIGIGDENETKDMQRLVNACTSLQDRYGATVVLIHHTDKGGRAARGSSALHGGIETQIRLFRNGDTVRVHCDKQRDDDEFDDFHLRRETVDLGVDVENKPYSSIVLVPNGSGTSNPKSLDKQRLATEALCWATWDVAGESAVEGTRVQERLAWTKSTFHRTRDQLESEHFLEVNRDVKPNTIRLLAPGIECAKSHVPTCSTRSQQESGTTSPTSQRPRALLNKRGAAGRTGSRDGQRASKRKRSEEGA